MSLRLRTDWIETQQDWFFSGKNRQTLQALNQMIRHRCGFVGKFYLTITAEEMREPMVLTDRMEKESGNNRIKVLPKDGERGKLMDTIAKAAENGKGIYPCRGRVDYRQNASNPCSFEKSGISSYRRWEIWGSGSK